MNRSYLHYQFCSCIIWNPHDLSFFVSFPTKLRQAKYQWELDIPFPTTKYGPPSNDAKCRVQGLKSELNLQSWKQWRVIHVRRVIYLCILWLCYVWIYVYMFIFVFFNQSLLFGAFNMVSSFWYKMMCVMCRMFPTYHSIGRFWNGHNWLHPCWNVCVTNIQDNSACVPVVPLSWLNIHPIIVCFQLDWSASWWCGSLVFLDSYYRIPWWQGFLLTKTPRIPNHQPKPLHPGKLTWNPKMEVWFRWFSLSIGVIFRFHVHFPGCSWTDWKNNKSTPRENWKTKKTKVPWKMNHVENGGTLWDG